MFLLIFPSSLLAGLINRQVGFVRKYSLWSFIVIKACVFARQLIRSSNSSFLAISFASRLISCSRSFGAFLICFVDVYLKDFPMFFGVLFINIASFVCENKDVG